MASDVSSVLALVKYWTVSMDYLSNTPLTAVRKVATIECHNVHFS